MASRLRWSERCSGRRGEAQSPSPAGPSQQGEAGRAAAAPAGGGSRGSHLGVQIPDGAREGKYDGARLLSVVPSERNRGNGHKQEIT